jgi:hypothetical protein
MKNIYLILLLIIISLPIISAESDDCLNKVNTAQALGVLRYFAQDAEFVTCRNEGVGLWSRFSDHLYYLNGYIGIGTNDPQSELDVRGTTKTDNIVITNLASPGNGNSYACIDENGILYRGDNPCTITTTYDGIKFRKGTFVFDDSDYIFNFRDGNVAEEFSGMPECPTNAANNNPILISFYGDASLNLLMPNDNSYCYFSGSLNENGIMSIDNFPLNFTYTFNEAMDTFKIILNQIHTGPIPKFVTSNHIYLMNIEKISKFRSAEGHDYWDSFENCRSMKHYFWPLGGDPGQSHNPSWTDIEIRSPIDGTIYRVDLEGTPNSGEQIWIRSTEYPGITIIIFHINLNSELSIGDSVLAEELIGIHASDNTMDDIAVGVNTPDGWKLISFFDIMTDTLFNEYITRGLISREDIIISQSERDADPLTCEGETFTSTGNIPNWVILN